MGQSTLGASQQSAAHHSCPLCSAGLPQSPASSARPPRAQHHSHAGGSEEKQPQTSPSFASNHQVLPCDLPFLTSTHSITTLKQAEHQKPTRHFTAHPLPWGEDERPHEECQFSSSALQEHTRDRSSLTTTCQNPRELPFRTEKTLRQIFRNRVAVLLVLRCQWPPAVTAGPSPRSRACCLGKDTRRKAAFSSPTLQPFQIFLVSNPAHRLMPCSCLLQKAQTQWVA